MCARMREAHNRVAISGVMMSECRACPMSATEQILVALSSKAKFSTLSRFVALWVLACLCATSAANALDPNRKISLYGHTAWRIQDGAVASGFSITQTPDGYTAGPQCQGDAGRPHRHRVAWSGSQADALSERSFPRNQRTEWGIVGGLLPKVLSMAKLAPITTLTEPSGSILGLAELIERGDCFE